MLNINSSLKEINKTKASHRDFGYTNYDGLTDIELFQGTVIKETGVPSLEEGVGKVVIPEVTEILKELEVGGTCWQSAVEEAIFILLIHRRKDIIEKLRDSEHEWSQVGEMFLEEISDFIATVFPD